MIVPFFNQLEAKFEMYLSTFRHSFCSTANVPKSCRPINANASSRNGGPIEAILHQLHIRLLA